MNVSTLIFTINFDFVLILSAMAKMTKMAVAWQK